MLDVVSAGATATSERDWYDIWQHSKEAAELQREVDQIHNDGLNRPPVETTLHNEFAASWGYQLTQDGFQQLTLPTTQSTHTALPNLSRDGQSAEVGGSGAGRVQQCQAQN
jgi:hypothetical protein